MFRTKPFAKACLEESRFHPGALDTLYPGWQIVAVPLCMLTPLWSTNLLKGQMFRFTQVFPDTPSHKRVDLVMGSVFGVEAICKLITDVLPFIFKVTKNHSTAGRAKKAQELVDKTRAMLRSYWEQMTVAEREEFRDMLDNVTQLQQVLEGRHQVPQSLSIDNQATSHDLKRAANLLWDRCLSTSNKYENECFDPYNSKVEEHVMAQLETQKQLPQATGLPATQGLFLVSASMDPPGAPIPANPLGITSSTQIIVNFSSTEKPTERQYCEAARTTGRALACTRRN